MNLRNDKYDYNSVKLNIPKPQYPAIESLLKRLRSNERFKIQEIINKNFQDPNSRASNSSLSQRSSSYDKWYNSLTYNSYDESPNDNNDQITPENKRLRPNKLPSLRLKDNTTTTTTTTTTKKAYPSIEREREKSMTSDVSSFEKKIIETGSKVPNLTSECWVIFDAKNNELLYGNQENKRREIASLTKIMTCYAVCKLIKEYNVDAKNTYIQVSNTAASMIGTSANLQAGDILSIWDLLHGMMLPSGNDAAYSLAESFGTYIYLQSTEYKERMKYHPELANQKHKNNMKYFLELMNKCAEELNLKNTYYANAHGLINHHNKSTAADVGRLSITALKNDLIKQIVSTKKYVCEIEQHDKSIRTITWENTNKLLDDGWNGIKTGITTAAGPCLSASYIDSLGNQYVIVLLCASSMDQRWEEANKLVKWVIEIRKFYRF